MQDVIDFNLLKEYDTTLKDILEVWTKQKAYSLGDKVKYKGHLLECTTAGTSGTTTLNFTNLDIGDIITDGTVVWELVEEESGKGIDFYTVGESYKVGDIVIYSGNIYQCITAHTATSTFDNTKWEEISKSGIPYYNQDTSYEVDDQVIYDNKIYKCITTHTSTATFDATKWTEISAGGGGIAEYTTGTSYSSGDLVIKDQALYQANTTTSTTWVESEWDVIGTSFNTTSTYAQKIVTNVVAPYEMLLQVGDSNYCKPPIDVLKKTGGSDNVTLTLENYNNSSAYTGTSEFLKIENSKAKLYNYKEYPITPQTLSTIDIGVSDEINFDEFVSSSSGTPDSNTLALLHFDEDAVTDATGRTWSSETGLFPELDTTDKKFGNSSAYFNGSSTIGTNYDSVFDFGTGDFTVDFWWKQPTSGSIYTDDAGVFLGGYATELIGIACSYSSSALIMKMFRSYMSDDVVFSTDIRKTDGEFHHYAIVRSSGTVHLFIDGELLDSKPNNVSYSMSSSAILCIGGWGINPHRINIFGNIDEFRISNIARWTSDFTPPTQPYYSHQYNISSLEVD